MKKTISICIILVVLLCFFGCKSSDYNKAVALQDAGSYAEAILLFEKIGDYKDSSTRLNDCKTVIQYEKAVEKQNSSQYEEASILFEELGNYQDSSDRLSLCQNTIKYNKAVDLQTSKDYASAADLFRTLQGFLDSDTRLSDCEEMIAAIDKYNAAVAILSEKNDAYSAIIDLSVSMAASADKALDETTRDILVSAISDARNNIVGIPEMANTANEIIEQANTISSVDYQDAIQSLTSVQKEFEKSQKQYALVNNPSEEYVISRLQTVPGILLIEAATEDNDPNGQLHKPGGYTSAIYFSYDKVKDRFTLEELQSEGLLKTGTDAGGQIEVYATEKDAIRRNEYLGTFDGTILSSGSHIVLGTCVVRTSDELTATQQKELETLLIAVLTDLGE
ncbi:MAG: hypothetical protein IKP38_06275 [Clostridia bacterium]|nr:hypothetical protein [Clostridia bacterium]